MSKWTRVPVALPAPGTASGTAWRVPRVFQAGTSGTCRVFLEKSQLGSEASSSSRATTPSGPNNPSQKSYQNLWQHSMTLDLPLKSSLMNHLYQPQAMTYQPQAMTDI
ncbi:uncharacterized protein PGTG_19458 [Puccinia graminis f. sp. tritici CRL 75-36-700-3]|uniref:Uncharacterized protein n=1 Tax=Puccinia graminis f. sp. tritici (strain CRL 75-36-700-3 / race SCCL) TaxID=418459 RepID=E3L9J4_PUCGT|nr:uncharacterized protein PGTG_19458 [Puccinia graminis f. sp. tritici CRL 75-36-700-3]EFP93219.1 hypothetical protein PGTG_19458 [Puccinia graminis f. sp. tritici CRL 75-36-700-3]